MLEKLELIFDRWKTVEGELSSPDAMSDMKRFAQLNKEYKDLTKIVDQYHIYRNILSNIDTNKEILGYRERRRVPGDGQNGTGRIA